MKKKSILATCSLPIAVLGPAGILLTLPGVAANFSEIKFNNRLLYESLAVALLFVLAYLFTNNEGVIRSAILIVLNVMLFSIVTAATWANNRSYVVDVVYWINLLILVLSYAFAPVAVLLGMADTSLERIGGLIGYDFIGFFVSVYIISKIESGEIIFGWRLIFHLSLATFVTLNAGRFGIFIIFLLYIFVIIKFASLKTLIASVFLVFIGYLFNSDRIDLILRTLQGVYEFVVEGSDEFILAIPSSSAAGFYAASPLTWISEFSPAFENIEEHIFSSSDYLPVDSGPAYMILNSGLVLTVLYYRLLFRFLNKSRSINIIIVAVFLATDIKLRCAFSVFPMLWIYLNSFHSPQLRMHDQVLVNARP